MKRALPAVIGCALLAGCGGAGHDPLTAAKRTNTTVTPNPTAQLEQAVRTALHANAAVSVYVLEHNAIPASASQSTAGPALAGMRGSAAQRKTGHITVRVLFNEVQIHSIQIDPSYETALATATDRSRVVPYRKGRALGKAITSSERTQFKLRRVGGATKFVVWSVAAG
jgi:hypothetical protein